MNQRTTVPSNPAPILSGSSARLRTSRLAAVVVKHRVAAAGRMLRKHRHAVIILPLSGPQTHLDTLLWYVVLE